MIEEQNSASTEPGTVLRAARTEQGLSLEAVAASLHLRQGVVEAMEQGRFNEFESALFLKGYFRSYCRLVGLHEERMLELLEQSLARQDVSFAKGEAASLGATTSQPAKPKRKALVFVVCVLIIFVALAFVVQAKIDIAVLFNSQAKVTAQEEVIGQTELNTQTEANAQAESKTQAEGSQPSETESLADTASAATLKPELAASPEQIANKSTNKSANKRANNNPENAAETVTGIIDEGERKASQQNASFAEQTQRNENAEVKASDSNADELAQEESAQAEGLLNAKPKSVETQVDELAATSEAAITSAAPLTKISSPYEADLDVVVPKSLVVSFSDDCWFTLKNGEGKTIVSRLKKAGQTVTYDGPKPYRLVVGNAQAAKVNFEGKVFDMAAFTRRNGRASFVLE